MPVPSNSYDLVVVYVISFFAFIIGLGLLYFAYKKHSFTWTFSFYTSVKNLLVVPYGTPITVSARIIAKTDPILSPVSKCKCLYYSVEVLEEKERNDKSYWDKVLFYKKFIGGIAQDDSAKIEVDIGSSSIDSPAISSYKTHNLDDLRNKIEALILITFDENYKAELVSLLKNLPRKYSRYEVIEKVLFNGQFLFIYGACYLDGNSKIFKGTKDQPLILSNKIKEKILQENNIYMFIALFYGFVSVAISLYLLLTNLFR